MPLKDNIQAIKDFLLNRYKNNLAAILIFGSANTGHFQEGKSDIDHIILLKEQNGLDLEKESAMLHRKLKKYYFASQYLFTLQGILEHINRNGRKGWSTYITIASNDGSKVIYSAPEFEKFKKDLIKNPPTLKDIKKYIKEKDEFELEGYFKKIEGYNLTKSLMAHLRRKLQILNYFKTGRLIFDYEKCLTTIDITKEQKERLKELYQAYQQRKELTSKEIEDYTRLADEFTLKIFN